MKIKNFLESKNVQKFNDSSFQGSNVPEPPSKLNFLKFVFNDQLINPIIKLIYLKKQMKSKLNH